MGRLEVKAGSLKHHFDFTCRANFELYQNQASLAILVARSLTQIMQSHFELNILRLILGKLISVRACVSQAIFV